MNSLQKRKATAEFAVAAMVCGAVHFFFIAPAQQKLASLRSESADRSAQTAAGPSLSAEQLTALSRQARSAAEQIEARSLLAKDETRLFSEIMELAEATRVRIEQLQPVERVGRRPAGAGAAGVAPPGSTPAGSQRNGLAPNSDPAAADAAQPRDTSVGYRIVATASYGSLVEFLRRLPGELGFTVVKSVRVQPGDSEHPDLVRVQVETEHLAFDVGELANLTVAPGVGATRAAGVGDDAAEGGR